MKFRKKPVVIEAIQWNEENFEEIRDFVGAEKCEIDANLNTIFIHTLEGTMSASAGDWVIRGVKGEFYPCKPDIFEATYEQVESDEN